MIHAYFTMYGFLIRACTCTLNNIVRTLQYYYYATPGKPCKGSLGLHGNSTEGFLLKNLLCLECVCKVESSRVYTFFSPKARLFPGDLSFLGRWMSSVHEDVHNSPFDIAAKHKPLTSVKLNTKMSTYKGNVSKTCNISSGEGAQSIALISSYYSDSSCHSSPSSSAPFTSSSYFNSSFSFCISQFFFFFL